MRRDYLLGDFYQVVENSIYFYGIRHDDGDGGSFFTKGKCHGLF